MKVLLPNSVEHRLLVALRNAERREIGGILMGEHVGENCFRISDITVQFRGGSFTSFVRAVQGITAPLRRFFDHTNHDYGRFNYLGEWHSHPSFLPEPSTRDCETMWAIVNDTAVGAHFAILLIVRLLDESIVEGTVTVFTPEGRMAAGELVREEQII